MSVGTAIFLIFLIVAAAVAAWYFLVRRTSVKTAQEPARETATRPVYDAAPAGPAPVRYAQAPPVIVEQPVYVQPYRSPADDLVNLMVAEEIIDEIHEELREERYEEMREEHHYEETREERYEESSRYEEPARYDAPDTVSGDTGGGWGGDTGGYDGGGDFSGGDSGGF